MVSTYLGKQEAQEPIAKEELLTELTTFSDQFTDLLSKATESQLDAKTVDSLQKDQQMMQELLDLLQPPTWNTIRDLFANANLHEWVVNRKTMS